MDGIFIISFLIILFGSFIIDRKMLRKTETGNKITYGITIGLILLFLITKYFHVSIPMPSYFFVQVVSPWFIQVLGI
ncbi:hypothetical protein PAECIP111891_05752 [Paenibacillus allorhizoplanae]|uniref:Prepilin type IV endopeptidase peptidase domain-containing protein n=1 Tax=Paenibacillus allorhizoplanae TaxID=2905648 RepID=A0ABM9CWL6_9BACL|nr:hypothetical protein [Paenibacillus allorhizoplanae]CAH1224875.1 hypothetical protein PAECIP111891_05752 [Paenibacillus allorhizoplanae]